MSKKKQEEKITELQEIFRSFDGNNDGSLTQSELSSLLNSLGLKPSAEQLQILIRRADTNSNGLIEFSELAAVVVAPKKPVEYSEEQMKKMFRIFDRDGNGFITAAELARTMGKIGHPLTIQELNGMMEEADSNGDGKIDFSEFSRAISSAAFLNSPCP